MHELEYTVCRLPGGVVVSGAVSSLGASTSAGELGSSIEGAAADWSSETADKKENRKDILPQKSLKSSKALDMCWSDNFHWSTPDSSAIVKAVYLDISNVYV